jgi:hypothetical protein
MPSSQASDNSMPSQTGANPQSQINDSRPSQTATNPNPGTNNSSSGQSSSNTDSMSPGKYATPPNVDAE